MKKLIISKKLVISMVLLMGVGAAHALTITGSKHDLAGSLYSDDTVGSLGTCQYCHTPHTSLTEAPLWTRLSPTPSSFTPYTSPTLDAGTAGVAPDPGGISLACLSCHDGTMTLDPTGTGTDKMGDLTPATNGLVGTTLTGDHPVSIAYDAGDTGLQLIADARSSAMQLYGSSENMVECASCHDVHDNQIPPFLRAANNTAFCSSCHKK